MEDVQDKKLMGEVIHNISRGFTLQHPAEFIKQEAPPSIVESSYEGMIYMHWHD